MEKRPILNLITLPSKRCMTNVNSVVFTFWKDVK